MKKLPGFAGKLLCVLFIAAAGAVFAQEEEKESIGLTPGIELGAGDLADKAVFILRPRVEYENSFGNFDIFGELDYNLIFDDPVAHELELEIEPAYNLQIAEPSVLSIIVNNKNTFFLSPSLPSGETHLGVIEPAVQYTHTLDFGDLSGKVAVPFDYLTGTKDETMVGLTITAGWASNFGFGLELSGTIGLHPEADFLGYGLLVSYEKDMFYGEIECKADREFKELEILPEVNISLDPWVFIARMEILKADDSWAVRPFIGAGYRF
jgi:hypothetical protein